MREEKKGGSMGAPEASKDTEDAEELQRRNYTERTEFVLTGFSDFWELQPLLFAVILVGYMVVLVGNSLIFVVIVVFPTLHTPMYFFLGNLSILEICYTSITMPKMLINIVVDTRTISYAECFLQMYFFHLSGMAECLLLTAMAYDRYVAICHPLHYFLMMSRRVCVGLVACSWLGGSVMTIIQTMLLVRVHFCRSNIINHFFCDILPLIRLACGDTSVNENELLVASVLVVLIPFMLIIVSYIQIISTILSMPSAESRRKAFSTCSAHLMVVFLFYGSVTASYLGNTIAPELESHSNKFISLLYTMVTPMLNPIIYSLRNKEVKEALKVLMNKGGDCLRLRPKSSS